MRMVEEAETAKAAWDALREDHLGSLQTRRPMLLGEVRELRQGQKETVEAYGDRAKLLLSRLGDLELSCADVLVSDAFLQGLLPVFTTCVPLLTKIVDEGFDAVLLELKNLTRLLPAALPRSGSAPGSCLQAEGRQPKKKETRRCFRCGKVGHLKKDCRQPAGGQQQQQQQPHQWQGEPGGGTVLMATACHEHAGSAMKVGPEDEGTLLFDTGATHHIVRDLGCFYNARTSDVKSIVVGGGESHPVVTEGDVDVRTDAGVVTLSGALCVPAMRYDLVSATQATSRGAQCYLLKDDFSVCDAMGKVVLGGSKHRGLYRVAGNVVPRETVTAEAAVVSGELAHRRLGHPGVSATGSMIKVMGTEPVKDCPGLVRNCGVCTTAKQSRDPFPRSESRAEGTLDLLHMDVMGPLPVASLGGARYVLTILDDNSRYSEVHVMKSKEEVFQHARGTMLVWQRQTGRKVKAVRTDNGSEFKGLLQEWMDQKGIIHQTSADYTPEQNGRSERLNRTLMEKTRALLLEHDLPQEFWGAAVDTACYLYNIISPQDGGKCPLELMFGAKPQLSLLRVFGCLAYVHIPKQLRDKLSACSMPGIFAGYERSCKAWRVYVWDGSAFTVLKSRNVNFLEHARPDDVLEECNLQSEYTVFVPPAQAYDEDFEPAGHD